MTQGDDAVAFDLYLWNIGLAQAVLKDVSFFEVALRNAYDRAMGVLIEIETKGTPLKWLNNEPIT